MEISEQALSALKEKVRSALQAQQKTALDFVSRAGVEEIYEALLQQAQETAGFYPAFRLEAEVENGEFMALLQAGLPIRRAYEAVHHQELVEAALAYALEHAPAQRPGENGLADLSSAATAGSMASSTRAQRDAIRSRVSRGETVRL